MSALAVAVKAAAEKPSKCTFAAILPLFDADTVADLKVMLADPATTNSAIAKGLLAIGHPVKPDTVRRHRNRDCNCP